LRYCSKAFTVDLVIPVDSIVAYHHVNTNVLELLIHRVCKPVAQIHTPNSIVPRISYTRSSSQ
jgi:hypothetical protein